jgi:hypothetical protein
MLFRPSKTEKPTLMQPVTISRHISNTVIYIRNLTSHSNLYDGAGAVFLRVLRFGLPIFIPPISPKSPSSIIWGWNNRPVVAAVSSALGLTPVIIIIINHRLIAGTLLFKN